MMLSTCALPASYHLQLKNFPNPVWFAHINNPQWVFHEKLYPLSSSNQKNFQHPTHDTFSFCLHQVHSPLPLLLITVDEGSEQPVYPHLLHAGCDFINLCFLVHGSLQYCCISILPPKLIIKKKKKVTKKKKKIVTMLLRTTKSNPS